MRTDGSQKLTQVQLYRECPDWLHDFVKEIRQSGWEMEYLKAGKTMKTEPAAEPAVPIE